jgi:hypothetical protein
LHRGAINTVDLILSMMAATTTALLPALIARDVIGMRPDPRRCSDRGKHRDHGHRWHKFVQAETTRDARLKECVSCDNANSKRPQRLHRKLKMPKTSAPNKANHRLNAICFRYTGSQVLVRNARSCGVGGKGNKIPFPGFAGPFTT